MINNAILKNKGERLKEYKKDMDEMWKKIAQIKDKKEKGKFLNYIEYMVFPYFKNLVPNTKITLEFPMTILVGRNGSGKSSTLQAFYGAPLGHSCGEFWFSTNLDPIIESGDDTRHRFFYGYKETKNSPIKEVRMARIKRSGSTTKKENPDYWETTRPSKQDGMLIIEDMRKRNSPVKKEVIYIDFRGELSAFDKYFYFSENKKEKKQDFLRRKSIYLQRLFNQEELYYAPHSRGVKIADEVISLSNKCIGHINQILGKNYCEIKMVNHKIYDNWGVSILIKTKLENKYSEANAGSGEIAVIKLVHKVLMAPPYSLILLDEPEVSLHPSAQVNLKLFLLNQIDEKKHQVIISSHSPALIHDMPDQALKLFETQEDGRFTVKNNVSFREAFYNIENYAFDKKTIICEDEAAKCLLDKMLLKMDKLQYFNVVYIPGGADTILTKNLPTMAKKELDLKNIFIILDGDKDKKVRYNLKNLTHEQLISVETLKELVEEVTGCNIPTYEDGVKGRGRIDQKIEILKQYIQFHHDNIFYLPGGKIPEELILESTYIQQNNQKILNNYSEINNINAKEIIRDIAMDLHGECAKQYIDSTISIYTNKWVNEDGEHQREIMNILNRIFEK